MLDSFFNKSVAAWRTEGLFSRGKPVNEFIIRIFYYLCIVTYRTYKTYDIRSAFGFLDRKTGRAVLSLALVDLSEQYILLCLGNNCLYRSHLFCYEVAKWPSNKRSYP